GEGAFEAVEDGIREFRICIGKRNLRALVEESQRGCERLVYRELPACLEKFRDELSDSRRRELEANLKELVRGYARDLLGAMERAAAGEDVNPDPGSADVVSRAGVQ
ncbi:MAG: hypothetical protein QGG40_15590, partial [Myxococcota bacterium]|nr:hypothetical protein [Myxococcota bacterium]